MGPTFIVCFALCFVVLVVESVRHGDVSMCPRFSVQKNSIIRTKDSKSRGARMLAKQNVVSARECFLLCCERDNCNVGIMRYRHSEDDETGRERVEKKCYMFDCKEPNVCTYVNHTGYASIQLHRVKVEQPKEEKPVERCAPGVPVAMCSDDPCETHSCPRFPDANCKASYCGGCKAIFYVDGRQVNCGDENHKTPLIASDKVVSTAQPDVADQATGTVNEEEVEINPDEAGEAPTENPSNENEEDPYAVHEWRHYLTDPAERQKTAPPSPATSSVIPSADTTTKEPKILINKVKYLNGGATSVPLLIALVACIIVLIAVIWRLRFSRRGKLNKKFAVDDGDYLINGMYL